MQASQPRPGGLCFCRGPGVREQGALELRYRKWRADGRRNQLSIICAIIHQSARVAIPRYEWTKCYASEQTRRVPKSRPGQSPSGAWHLHGLRAAAWAEASGRCCGGGRLAHRPGSGDWLPPKGTGHQGRRRPPTPRTDNGGIRGLLSGRRHRAESGRCRTDVDPATEVGRTRRRVVNWRPESARSGSLTGA